jgi:hypothetical protein
MRFEPQVETWADHALGVEVQASLLESYLFLESYLYREVFA